MEKIQNKKTPILENCIKIPTLLKFDPPILIKKDDFKEKQITEFNYNEGDERKDLCKDSANEKAEIDKILNSLHPPIIWTEEEGKTWKQTISKELGTRGDVIQLTKEVDKLMIKLKGKSIGICPIRSEIYRQTFVELIRQITLDSPDRGLLLLRIRDEMKMTLDFYRSLYISGILYSRAKDAHFDSIESETEEIVCEGMRMRENVNFLKSKLEDLRFKQENIRAKHFDRMETQRRAFSHNLQFLKRVHQQLKHQIEVSSSMAISVDVEILE